MCFVRTSNTCFKGCVPFEFPTGVAAGVRRQNPVSDESCFSYSYFLRKIITSLNKHNFLNLLKAILHVI
jgi:hypothetical protein